MAVNRTTAKVVWAGKAPVPWHLPVRLTAFVPNEGTVSIAGRLPTPTRVHPHQQRCFLLLRTAALSPELRCSTGCRAHCAPTWGP